MLKLPTGSSLLKGLRQGSESDAPLNQGDKRMAENPEKVLDEIIEIMGNGMKHSPDNPQKRSQHPKAQGILWGEFCVDEATLEAIPEELSSLKVGLLSQIKNYPSWIRFSNLKTTNDAKGDIHGMAIKIMEAEGESLPGSEDGVQDFALIDVPVFFLKDRYGYRDLFRAAASFKKILKLKGPQRFFQRFAQLVSTAHHIRQFLMPSPCPMTWRFRNIGILAKYKIQKKRHKPNTLLHEQFWSPTPLKWGEHTVKITLQPWEMNAASKVKFTPDYLRQQMIQRLTVDRKEAVFDVMLQVASDNEPAINDPTKQWTNSTIVKVATLRIPPQVFTRSQQEIFGEKLSFSPWHGLKAHEPIGDLNIIRRRVYQEMAKLRAEKQDKPQPEYQPENFEPSLLPRTPIYKQNGITAFVPIKEGRIPALHEALEKFKEGEGFARSPLTHFARFVIFKDDDLDFPPQLLFSSNFDGDQELYLEELVQKLGHELDAIFQHCESYTSGSAQNFSRFRAFIQKFDIPIPAFYVGCRGASAQEIINNRNLRERLYGHMSQETDVRAELLELNKLTPQTPPRPEPSQKFGTVVKISRWVGRKVWSFIGVNPTQNDPSEREVYTDYAKARMKAVAESEDPTLQVQNQLSTLSRIKSDRHLWVLRLVLKLVNQVGGYSRGTLSGIGTIHFARWVILEKGTLEKDRAYLFFESNYGDTWDNYLEDFVYLTITAMNSIWANLEKYPKNGCQDVELFKRHSKTRQFEAQVFYCAYPDVSIKNILSDRKLSQAMGVVGDFVQGRYRIMQDVDDHPFMRFVKRVNRMD